MTCAGIGDDVSEHDTRETNELTSCTAVTVHLATISLDV
jgi:hypothetical protein